MTAKDIVLNHLVHTFTVDAMQVSLSNAVRGLTLAQAAWKPSPERHSIWQIVRHLAQWKEAAASALDGHPLDYDELNRRDWQEVTGDESAWQKDVERLRAVSARIEAHVRAMDEGDLSRSIKWYKESPTPVAIATRLVWLGTHDAYHAGQIQQLFALQRVPVEEFVMAASRGEIGRMQTLLKQHQTLLDAHSRDGWMGLHVATYFGFEEAVRFLLDRGANVNAISQNEGGRTPLHAAVARRRVELVTLLLDRGADVGIRDAEGRTPLDLADRQGADEIVRLLRDAAVSERPR